MKEKRDTSINIGVSRILLWMVITGVITCVTFSLFITFGGTKMDNIRKTGVANHKLNHTVDHKVRSVKLKSCPK